MDLDQAHAIYNSFENLKYDNKHTKNTKTAIIPSRDFINFNDED